jgi:pimeloyl-ACP methyl ester carboxylesterase
MLHLKKLIKSRFSGIVIRVISILLVLYVGLSILGAVLIMGVPRIPVEGSPVSVDLTYSDVSFPTRGDHITLRGWYLPGQGDSALLIVPGGFQNRLDYEVDTLGLARDLVGRGYNVLLFDLRGRGESEGKGISMQNINSDIGGAIDYLKSRGFATEKIGIIGFCSGAASAAIFANGEEIGALVLDGCFTTVRGMVTRQAATKNIPEFLVDVFVPSLSFTVKIFYGYEPFDPVVAVSNTTCPVLFIHEEYDNLTTLEETDQLLKASNSPASEMWEVSGVEHTQAYKTYPAEYVDRLDNFLAKQFETP